MEKGTRQEREIVQKTNEGTIETVLVTGATGFLGEYLVRCLTKKYKVLALGRNREKGKQLEKLGAVFCQGDFTDPKSCSKYFQGVHFVIHAGALSTVWGKWEDFYKTNVFGTAAVAKLCLKNKVKRLVYISSPSIYTEKQDRYNIKENQVPVKNKLNFYIKSKLMAEQIISKWNRKGLETVILRPRGLIGIGDTSLVPRLLRANASIGIPLIRGGHSMVDLTSVENVAFACQLCLSVKEANGKVFNITNGEPMEFKVLLEYFLTSIGEQPHYRKLPFQIIYNGAAALEWIYKRFHLSGEPPLTRYTVCTLGFAQTMDISKAKEILGYQPKKTLAESIQEYGQWWKEMQTEKRIEISDVPSQITKVKLYHCGSCTNNLQLLFKNYHREKREFPAMAALIQHKHLGNILFDTGYSEKIFQKSFFLKLYRILNPVHLEPNQVISEKLKSDGINLESVKTIILSHAHPDHIGGLSKFYNYKLVVTKKVLETLEYPKFRNLVFSNLIPQKEIIKSKYHPEKQLTNHFLCEYFEQVYDLFEDGSVIGVVLDGHCKGQMGIWIPDFKLFLAADACWGNDLVRATSQMKLLPRLIQKNFSSYKKTLKKLCMLKKDYPEIQIIFTHQKGRERVYG